MAFIAAGRACDYDGARATLNRDRAIVHLDFSHGGFSLRLEEARRLMADLADAISLGETMQAAAEARAEDGDEETRL